MNPKTATAASLILDDLGVDLSSTDAGPKPTRSLHARRSALSSPQQQLQRLDALPLRASDGGSPEFSSVLERHGWATFHAGRVEMLQINLGKLCNMTCRHCHVDAGPDRVDAMMSEETIEDVLRLVAQSAVHTVDITGGAPELHPSFCRIVECAASLGKHVIDRCNLTILLVPKFNALPSFLAEHHVEIVASLPHYRILNTDAQRGTGTYEKSIAALRVLNDVGYGKGDPDRVLTLMSNPAGAFLGGDQTAMEAEWKEQLWRHHGVTFDRLFVLNNMPISRYLEWLDASGNTEAYLQKLLDAFNPAAVNGVMCRNTLSVSWDGRLFDCDFNQMLDIEAQSRDGVTLSIRDVFSTERYDERVIQTARHCFGCTAGCGSSCGGATSAS